MDFFKNCGGVAMVRVGVLILISLLSACASHNYTDAPPTMGFLCSKYAYIAYDGDLKPSSDIGVITTDGRVSIERVNGDLVASNWRCYKQKGFYSGGRYQLRLAQGEYVLTLSFHQDLGDGNIYYSRRNLDKSISIAAGQIIHLEGWPARELDGSAARGVIDKEYEELILKESRCK